MIAFENVKEPFQLDLVLLQVARNFVSASSQQNFPLLGGFFMENVVNLHV